MSPHTDGAGILRCIPAAWGETVFYSWSVKIVGSADPDFCSVEVNRAGRIAGVTYHPASGGD